MQKKKKKVHILSNTGCKCYYPVFPLAVYALQEYITMYYKLISHLS